MKKMMKLLTRSNQKIAYTVIPRTGEQLWERIEDYKKLKPNAFANKHGFEWNEPFALFYNNNEHQIQYNFCTDPFCAWYRLPQEKFVGKNQRYKKSGSPDEKPKMMCNENPQESNNHVITKKSFRLLSNFAISEEIVRLIAVNSVVENRPDYNFHKDSCISNNSTPFNAPEKFIKKGKSSSNSQRWQCKSCNKITHTLPALRERFNYNQKRNEVLLKLAEQMPSRTPIKKMCKILKIGNSTYYSKLELLYRRCLEFLEEHETKALASHQFSETYLDTDILVYFLNNVRKKGKGGKWYDDRVKKETLETHIVATGEIFSRYVLRADVAFDWLMPMDELFSYTFGLKEDHLYNFQRANAHLRNHQYYPQPPTENDAQTQKQFETELKEIQERSRLLDGFHLNSTYTALAQYWLIKNMVNTKNWIINSDDDSSLKTAVLRVFAEEVAKKNAHYFISCIDDTKSKHEAFKEYKANQELLFEWGKREGFTTKNKDELAEKYLASSLESFPLYEFANKRPISSNKIIHPLPSIDEGWRDIRCLTDISGLSRSEQAELICRINSRVLKSFFGKVRRGISVLERPFVTARGDKKSYIYANCNPKYAQYSTTILRTLHNFCHPWKTYEKVMVYGKRKRVAVDNLTPAQRLGITDRVFDIKDIIYFK